MTQSPDPGLLPAFPKLLGITLTQALPDRVCAEMPVGDTHANRNGVMHGGAILAFADAVGGTAASLNLNNGEATTTLESKSNFLRPVPLGQKVYATCIPKHVGRKTAVYQITISREDGKTAAIITQTQMTLNWAKSNE